MFRKNNMIASIPALIALILLPQLVFFWLVPAGAAARYIIYCVGTILTFTSFGVIFFSRKFCSLRRSIGIAVTAVMLELAAIAVCTVLLVLNTTIRTAAFALTTAVLVYLACLIPMICLPGRGNAAVLQEPVSHPEEESDAPETTERADQRRNAPPALPPRNR